MNVLDHTKDVIRTLPERKRYFEFITAALSVPVLITVIYTNVNNIKNAQKPPEATKQAVAAETNASPVVIEIKNDSPTPPPQSTESSTVKEVIKECEKTVGDISLSSPLDGSTITESPLTIDIHHEQDNHCAVVWSYRLNNGNWSTFTDKAISLFDVAQGEKKLEVRVRSIASDDEKTLDATFSYQPPETAVSSPTPSPTAVPEG